MAKEKPSPEREATIHAQNTACDQWPREKEKRSLSVKQWLAKERAEKEAVERAKITALIEHDSKGAVERLIKRNGWTDLALKTVKGLVKLSPQEASKTLRQLIEYGKDEEVIIPDFFDEDSIGAAYEGGDDASVFDSTATGKAQGGAKAQPRGTEEMAASHAGPAPKPGLDLSTAEARAAVIAKFEEAAAARKGKRGPKPPEFVELQAAADAAKEAEKVAQAAPADPAPGAEKAGSAAPAEDPDAEPEKSNVVSISDSMRKANAAGDEHIRKQSEQMMRERGNGKPDKVNEAKADAPADKPKRTSRKKADAPADPKPSTAKAGPGVPPAEDDEDEGEATFQGAPLGHGQIGDQPSSYTVR